MISQFGYPQQGNISVAFINNGIQGAHQFTVGAGNTVIIFDTDHKQFFIKEVGQNGFPQPLRSYNYEELCRECDAILKKERHSISDVEKFNTLCKAKRNLEQFSGYSNERYTNASYMNHGLNSPELSYGNSYQRDGMSRDGYSEHMSSGNNYMSHHSILDRLINATEGLMDQAGSDFERKVLKTWANKMRTEGYGD